MALVPFYDQDGIAFCLPNLRELLQYNLNIVERIKAEWLKLALVFVPNMDKVVFIYHDVSSLDVCFSCNSHAYATYFDKSMWYFRLFFCCSRSVLVLFSLGHNHINLNYAAKM